MNYPPDRIAELTSRRLGACEPSAGKAPNPHRVRTEKKRPDQAVNFSEIAGDG